MTTVIDITPVLHDDLTARKHARQGDKDMALHHYRRARVALMETIRLSNLAAHFHALIEMNN